MNYVRPVWSAVALGACLLLAAPERAAAQLSAHSGSTSGSSCSGSNNSDGFCGFSRATLIANGTQFQSRYAWNINADVGAFSTRDTSGTGVHSMSFTATAPGSYQVSIGQSFVGAMGRINDTSGCNGQANVSGVSGSTNIGINSGTLSVADPGSIGNGGSTTSIGFGPGASATIGPRLSNGVGQGHSLSFSFNGNVRSNSCEASVRLGQQNGSTTGCNACGYAGSPSRTQASDGHFVTVTFTSFCGDGVINGTGEQCDTGGANGTAGSCCNTNCTLKSNGTGCTDDGNVCTNDTCNGVSPVCQHPNNSAPCSDGLFCNGTDTCSGGTCAIHTGNPCPGADGDGDCSETCSESTDSCTANDPNGSACTDGLFCNGSDTCSAGVCSGHSGNPCPGNNVGPNCADSCSESADNCLAPDAGGTSCSDGLFCTGTETCNGSGTCTTTGNPCPGPDGDGNCSESCSEASDNCLAPDPNGSVCADGLFCNGTDTCGGGTCSTHTGDPCPGADGDGNCAESCSEASDNCLAPDPNGSVCADGLFCNGTDTCGGGTCSTHTGDPCPGADGDGNCAESCSEAADNCLAPDPNGSACTDGLFCSGTETCTSGTCTNSTGDPCPGADGDGNCSESCNEAGDDCLAPDPNGSVCTDSLFCNGTDTCGGGTCSTHTGDPCPGADGDGDCSESCNEAADDCLAPDPNGAACTDSLFCNGTDTCGGGTCSTHTGDPCIGGTECADACNETADDCFDLAGTGCTDDTNPCTTDTCDGGGLCDHQAGNPGALCRPVAGGCDVAENCDGTNAACPTDGFVAGGTECRASAGFCDVAEDCTGVGPACPADGFQPSTLECRADAGECDVAENCTGGGALCPPDGFDPDGSACTDGDNCTFAEFCTGGSCGDGTDVNTTCAACEACDPNNGLCVPGPRTNCLRPTVAAKARLLVKDKSADKADLVVWKWIKGEETVVADFGDPENTDDYALCVFDAGNTEVNAAIPAGGTCGSGPCWRPLGSSGFKYINRERTPDGILKVLLKAGTDGRAKVIVKGKGENLPFGPGLLPMETPVDVQLQVDGGACFATTHVATGPFFNSPELYKAVDEGP